MDLDSWKLEDVLEIQTNVPPPPLVMDRVNAILCNISCSSEFG